MKKNKEVSEVKDGKSDTRHEYCLSCVYDIVNEVHFHGKRGIFNVLVRINQNNSGRN